jgi:hypothetical protein
MHTLVAFYVHNKTYHMIFFLNEDKKERQVEAHFFAKEK